MSNRKDKNTDPDDFLLSQGAAYFVHEGDVARYLPKLGDLKIEVSWLCDSILQCSLICPSTQRATSLGRWATRGIGVLSPAWC